VKSAFCEIRSKGVISAELPVPINASVARLPIECYKGATFAGDNDVGAAFSAMGATGATVF
jgi:hypothetical protein